MRDADDRGLGDGFVGDEGAFDFGGAEAVAADVEDVVHAAGDPEVAVLVAAGAVAAEVHAGDVAPVGLLVALRVAEDAAEHRRPRLADDEQARLALRNFLAVAVDDGGVDAEDGERGAAGDGGRGARQRAEHVAAGFGLPPGVDDGALLVADDLVVPAPGLGVDGLADGAEEGEAGEVARAGQFLAGLHEGADGGRGGVEDGGAVALDHLPEACEVGEVGGALVHQVGRAVEERAVGDVGVAGDPADVGGAPVDVLVLEVEDVLAGEVGVEQVAGGGVDDALGLAGGAAGVEDEEGVLGLGLGRRAGVVLAFDEVGPPDVLVAHRDVVLAPLEDDDLLDALALADGLVDVGLERHDLAATPAAVGGDDELRLRVGDAIGDGLAAEAAEDHAVRRAEAGAGEHRDDGLGHHRQVERDDIALLHADRLEAVGEAADLVAQVVVADAADLDGLVVLVDGLAFPEDGRLVAAAGVDDAVEAVVAGVDLAAVEPLGVGLVPLEDGVPLLVPVQLVGLLGPPGFGLVDRPLVFAAIRLHRVDAGLALEGFVGLVELGGVLRHDGKGSGGTASMSTGKALRYGRRVISGLSGKLVGVSEDRAQVSAGPMTVEVLVPAGDLPNLEPRVGEDVTFHTVCYLEGDASGGNLTPRLVGFASEADKGFFNAFVTVKGIGPRKALRALAIPAADVAAAIESKDTKALVALPQIGKRAAETIIAELAGKVGRFVTGGLPTSTTGPTPPKSSIGSLTPDEADAVDAMVALGERRVDAESLLERVRKREGAPTDTDALIAAMLALRGGR